MFLNHFVKLGTENLTKYLISKGADINAYINGGQFCWVCKTFLWFVIQGKY